MSLTKVIPDMVEGGISVTNLLINGDMRIAQRGTQTGLGGVDNEYTVDRWKVKSQNSPQARWTATQESSGGVSGKDKWLKFLCTTSSATLDATEAIGFEQPVEAQNCMSLADGSGGVIATSLSFDVILHGDAASAWDASFPVTMGFYIPYPDGGRQYLGLATVTAADTWERLTFSIPVDSAAVVNNDNGIGIRVGFCLSAGSSKLGTAGWGADTNNEYGPTGSIDIGDAVNNYIGITNVQLEVGDAASDFEHRSIADELLRCQRYYWRMDITDQRFMVGCYDATNALGEMMTHPSGPMRAAPSMSFTSSAWRVAHNGSIHDTTVTLSLGTESNHSWQINVSVMISGSQGQVYWILAAAATTAYIEADAEL